MNRGTLAPIGPRELSPTAHGWLPAALPARATRFRVVDDAIANLLSDAGADLTSGSPDVEILDAVSAQAGSDADVAIVVLDHPDASSGGKLVERARHVAKVVKLRTRVAQARRQLIRHGYRNVSVLLWDLGGPALLSGLKSGAFIDHLTRRAVVIGSRVEPQPTILAAALAQAVASAAERPPVRGVWVRAHLSVVATDDGVLRIAVGEHGARQIASQGAALRALKAGNAPPSVALRIPWPLATGRTGIADWSLEQLLPGQPAARLTPELVDECLEFLIGLHGTRGGSQHSRSLTAVADTVASACRAEDAARARNLGGLLNRHLNELPRCFGHGDFFPGNLLVADGHLTGVIDWDAGGPGHLPLVDLFHLQLTRSAYGLDSDWGTAVTERLLPQAQAGGNPETRNYCRAIGIDPDPVLLRHLVFAYWLGYVEYQMRTHPGRLHERVWIERNVEHVLRSFAAYDPIEG